VTVREFHATKKVGWSDHDAKRWMERLEKDIFPWLGKLPLSQIGAPMLLQTLRRVEARGTRELPTACWKPAGRCFDPAWPLDVVSAVPRPICAAHSNRRCPGTSRRSSSPIRSAT
jgi:hypothetical protein